ncbi:MAG: carbohydrate binding family 9 domain-containing protein [Candidatus Eisenbacteria bacterium]|nr:carbohydrate binding family 9 domain-containing protein [Candidatus Eisenbacteria bacterium]
MNSLRGHALAVFLVVLAPAAASASPSARPTCAVTRASGPLRVDGVLDEPAWAAAPPITDFRLLYAREGQAPGESTAVRVLVDERRIVFGITCMESHRPAASVMPRDRITDGDFIAIHLDTDGDGQRAYIFGVNAFGVQLDGTLTDEPDFQWDGVWDAEVRRGPDRWTAEIAIPFRTLRFTEGGARPWRLWLRRQCESLNEVSSWPLWRQGEAGAIMLQAADLTGLAGLRGGHAVYLEPYVAGSLDAARGTDAPESREWSDSRRRAAGLDAQAAVTSALTLNATYRPDFSQIEADALLIEANQRFPLQYDEKRPFFLEGGDVFQTPLELVYTRRMASPIAGAKVAGRVGALRTGALWVRDEGGVSMAGSGHGPAADSKRGDYLLSRVELPFGEGNTVAVLGALHDQDGDFPGAFGPTAPAVARGSRNTVLAADAKLKLSDRLSWTGQIARTATRLDSAYTDSSLVFSGLQPEFRGERFSGGAWVSRLRYDTRSLTLHARVRGMGPRFRDELGFQERVGVRYQQAIAEWRMDPRDGPLQRAMWTNEALVIHGRNNALDYSFLNSWWDFQLRRNFEFSLGFEALDEFWLDRRYPQERVHAFLADNRWRPFTWTLETITGDGLWYGATPAESYRAWTETWLFDGTLRPQSWLTAAINLKHFRVARTPTRGEVVNVWLVGVNANAQFTRRLSARIYPQYDGGSKHLAVNALVGWVLHPGTVLYAGVNGGFDERVADRRMTATSRQVFAKTSWRFEL